MTSHDEVDLEAPALVSQHVIVILQLTTLKKARNISRLIVPEDWIQIAMTSVSSA